MEKRMVAGSRSSPIYSLSCKKQTNPHSTKLQERERNVTQWTVTLYIPPTLWHQKASQLALKSCIASHLVATGVCWTSQETYHRKLLWLVIYKEKLKNSSDPISHLQKVHTKYHMYAGWRNVKIVKWQLQHQDWSPNPFWECLSISHIHRHTHKASVCGHGHSFASLPVQTLLGETLKVKKFILTLNPCVANYLSLKIQFLIKSQLYWAVVCALLIYTISDKSHIIQLSFSWLRLVVKQQVVFGKYYPKQNARHRLYSLTLPKCVKDYLI